MIILVEDIVSYLRVSYMENCLYTSPVFSHFEKLAMLEGSEGTIVPYISINETLKSKVRIAN